MHRHNKNAGDCPEIALKKCIVVPTPFVKSVGGSLVEAGKQPPRPYTAEVAEAILKQCASSHTAGDGSREKTSGDAFDDRGLMVLVCRHDIPLYVCNIDTPGEQQMYFIALLIWLLLHLPDTTTVGTWYDINCVTWRMLMAVRPTIAVADVAATFNGVVDGAAVGATVAIADAVQYNVLLPGMMERLLHATSIMHAYAHQWECQLVFNPRMLLGVGLTDGEGSERLWSRICTLIGILRHVSVRPCHRFPCRCG